MNCLYLVSLWGLYLVSLWASLWLMFWWMTSPPCPYGWNHHRGCWTDREGELSTRCALIHCPQSTPDYRCNVTSLSSSWHLTHGKMTSLPWWTGTWTLNHEPSKLAPLSGICQGLLSQQRERKVRRCACYRALGVSLYHLSEKDVAEGATCESGSRSSINTDQAGTWSQISKPHTCGVQSSVLKLPRSWYLCYSSSTNGPRKASEIKDKIASHAQTTTSHFQMTAMVHVA